MNSDPLQTAPRRDVYSISRLNREARAVLEGSFPFIWVQGEISNLARPASGHLYFSLKDAHAQVRCALFKNRSRNITVAPENGMEVLVQAAVSLYEGRGEFQLIIERLEPAGEGALQRAFEELKQRLFKEGLFAEEHKREIPVYPRCIGVVTSSTGAAIRDILTVLGRRYPLARVIVYPVPVQGEGAGRRIANMIALADARAECDVLILARGGGSLEDLWAFNEEVVARAVYDCAIPIVSGVGHEIDVTIADFVADQRAATPSAAAELVSPDRARLEKHVETQARKIARDMRMTLARLQQHVLQLHRRLPHPLRYLQMTAQRLDGLSLRLTHGLRDCIYACRTRVQNYRAALDRCNPRQNIQRNVDRCRHLAGRLGHGMQHLLKLTERRLAAAAHTLHTVSPLATLGRGYAIVSSRDQAVVRDAATLREGDRIRARFAKGQAEATVSSVTAGDEKT